MLIIVEGPDGAGKSTLVNALCHALLDSRLASDVEVRKAGPPPCGSHPLDLYARPLLDYEPGTGRHVICDRWHVGEWVYPDIFERPSKADLPSWRWLELLLMSRGALIVRATAAVDTLAENLTRRGDDLVTVGQLQAIEQSYDLVLKTTHVPTFTYRFGDPLAVAEVITRARQLEAAVTPLRDFVTYVGPPRPRYLILGDVRHALSKVDLSKLPAEATRRYGPAFGPYPATSGHYLLSHLPQRLLDEGIGLANACDVDDTATLRNALGRPRTAVLGGRAWDCLSGQNTGPDWLAEFGSAPHPQYVRRFHHGHGKSYGQVVGSALDGAHELRWRP